MSFSDLSDIFKGRFDSGACLAFLLSLKAPERARAYVYDRHKQVFTNADAYKKLDERWQEYHCAVARSIWPVRASDLADLDFTRDLGDRLAFDISRFTDFMDGYAKVSKDIKPVLLHYALNYLLDFFSRTYLKYGQNSGHGVKMLSKEGQETVLQARAGIQVDGIFPRAVDAFYAVNQSSLFSNDGSMGIGHYFNVSGKTTPEKPKRKCCDEPRVTLSEMLDSYQYLNSLEHDLVTVANKILTAHLILFLVSSVSRYRAKDWFELQHDRDLSSKIELLNNDFITEWIPELLLQTSLLR